MKNKDDNAFLMTMRSMKRDQGLRKISINLIKKIFKLKIQKYLFQETLSANEDWVN